uniref:CCHC-type domain-containing protein n=1 Tax=Tanacetum cinerariifolium TaxID=118510 RepID=A0A6L2KEC7_TANCI|nr:hypothetical protein [Tanacetum cinerariifolium]
MVATSKISMLKPGEFEIWRIRFEQYILMIDYGLWKVIENCATLPKTQVVEGVTTVMPITTVEEKARRRLEVKARSTLMIGIPNEHQLKFNSIKDVKRLLEAVEKRFGGNAATKKTQRNLLKQQYKNFTASSLEMLDQTLIGIKSFQPNSPQRVHEDLEQIYPDDMEEMDLRWQLAMLTMRARRFLKKIEWKLTINGNETIGFDKYNMDCYNCHKRRHFARECRAPRNQDNKHKESSRKSSDQAEKGPNYAPMAFSSSSSNSKTGLESVKERLKFFKTNESIYLEDIKYLKVEIQLKEIAIRELRKKLEIAQKEKDSIQLNVKKFENASKSLNKLIECQIVDNYKKVLGYENYNAVPPPYTGNFMPLTPDLSFTGLDKFANKPVAENCKAKSSEEETKVVRKNDDALIIKEWVLDNEEENVSQPKIKKKIVRPNIVKK